MLSLGLVFALAQFLMIQAFAHAPAGVLAPFAYAQIVAATVVGIVFFDAVPDAWTLLGVAMIVGAGVWIARDAAALTYRLCWKRYLPAASDRAGKNRIYVRYLCPRSGESDHACLDSAF